MSCMRPEWKNIFMTRSTSLRPGILWSTNICWFEWESIDASWEKKDQSKDQWNCKGSWFYQFEHANMKVAIKELSIQGRVWILKFGSVNSSHHIYILTTTGPISIRLFVSNTRWDFQQQINKNNLKTVLLRLFCFLQLLILHHLPYSKHG